MTPSPDNSVDQLTMCSCVAGNYIVSYVIDCSPRLEVSTLINGIEDERVREGMTHAVDVLEEGMSSYSLRTYRQNWEIVTAELGKFEKGVAGRLSLILSGPIRRFRIWLRRLNAQRLVLCSGIKLLLQLHSLVKKIPGVSNSSSRGTEDVRDLGSVTFSK
ncbi:hypothetical protein BKA70DRAFT_1241918 [Coprinopsis sp. MPI-PUGE-AT-0042]|nr:hypothetical protein BKA70DRAFT_1241918 [Coprinopsis sp. MPI-PUGE-AT-0042]